MNEIAQSMEKLIDVLNHATTKDAATALVYYRQKARDMRLPAVKRGLYRSALRLLSYAAN